MRTDASLDGLGATLSQIIDSQERVIQYLSRTLQPSERHWPIQQLEALAIIWACESSRAFIIGTKVLIKTDHKSLQWLKESKIPRLIRWACRLEEYDYNIEYQPGKFNKSADALSRLPDLLENNLSSERKYPGLEINFNLERISLDELNVINEFHVKNVDITTFQRLQNEDSFIQHFIKRNGNHQFVNDKVVMKDKLVYKKDKNNMLLLVPQSLIKQILESYHDHALGGHRSRDRLYETLKKRFYWSGMYTDIKNYIKACELCLKIKTPQPLKHGLLSPIATKRPFQIVGVDIAYLPISTGGFRYVLVAIDYFTNWVEAGLLKTMSAEEVIRSFFKIIISRHGCPEFLISDSGSTFISSKVDALCECFKIIKRESTPYHPQAHGKVEKFIYFLKRTLALITPQTKLHKWDEMIDHCLYTYRTTMSRTLKTSPFQLLYGRQDLMPQDLAFNVYTNSDDNEKIDNYQYVLAKKLRHMYDQIYKNKIAEQSKYKTYYDLQHEEIKFNIGDKVIILFDVPTKGPLMPRWEGPFIIIEKVNPVTYKVENEEKIITIHVQRIKLANNVYNM